MRRGQNGGSRETLAVRRALFKELPSWDSPIEIMPLSPPHLSYHFFIHQ